MSLFQRLMTIDRRYIYIVLSIALLWPMFRPIGFPIPLESPAIAFYEVLSSLPEGSVILLSADFSDADKKEIVPMLRIVTDLCLQRQYRLLLISLWPNGCQRVLPYMEPYLQKYEALYGIDYLVLGDMQPYSDFLQESAVDFQAACQQYGNALAWPPFAYPILDGIETPHDIQAVVTFCSGDPGYTHWIQYWYATGACQTILTCMVAVNHPNTLSAYNAGNLKGSAGGLGGAATLESCHGVLGAGHGSFDCQSLGHLAILFFVLLGNIGYIGARLRGELHEEPEKESRWKRLTYDN